MTKLVKLTEPKIKNFQQLRKLVNTAKEKTNTIKESVKEKFNCLHLTKE